MKKRRIIKSIALMFWMGCIITINLKYGLLAHVITSLASFALGLAWAYDLIFDDEGDKRSK